MQRRNFLAAAWYAAAARGYAFEWNPPEDYSGGPGWENNPPTVCTPITRNPCEPEFAEPKNPIEAMPPMGAVCPSDCEAFAPHTGKLHKRRLWSTIDESKPADRALLLQVRDGYRKLRSLDDDDPRSLYYQSRLHEFYCGGVGEGNIHRTWAFLPWHRAFLYFHERILGHCLKKPDFRLPVWDWDSKPHIPQFFIDLGLPDFLAGPYARRPSETPQQWLTECVQQAWMMSRSFEEFCGPGNCSAGSCTAGRAAGGPHSTVHTKVVGGAMGNLQTAAADPLFYAHHANVDRFWTYWQKRYKLPAPKEWGEQTFYFYDEHKRLVRVKAAQLNDHRNLGYDYDLPQLLCDLEPMIITQNAVSESAGALLRGQVLPAVLGMFLGLKQGALANLELLAGLKSGSADLASRLNSHCWTSFPLQIAATMSSNTLEGGKYYLIRLRGAGQFNIAGMGVFESRHHLHLDDGVKVAVAGCLGPGAIEAIVSLANVAADWELVYVETENGREPKQGAPVHVIANPRLWISHPKKAFAAGVKWLGLQK